MGFLNLFRPNIEKLERRNDIEGLIKALGYVNEKIPGGPASIDLLEYVCQPVSAVHRP
jgi:hypothetical protein